MLTHKERYQLMYMMRLFGFRRAAKVVVLMIIGVRSDFDPDNQRRLADAHKTLRIPQGWIYDEAELQDYIRNPDLDVLRAWSAFEEIYNHARRHIVRAEIIEWAKSNGRELQEGWDKEYE